jgi:hypothetical protein
MSVFALAALVSVSTASAHPDGGTTADSAVEADALQGPWVDGGAHDEPPPTPIITTGPGSTGSQTIDVVGRGIRNVDGATTDVWAHDGYGYTGTFNAPCGGDPEAGIWVWDTHNPNKVEFVTIIPSPTGSRTNDVRVAGMNSGDVLVHSNESCDGGPGGFEIYSVDDPASPQRLASVQTDDVNLLLRDDLGFTDFGVHNLFLFTQGDRDYVAAVVESEFGNFQIFDITDPANPVRVGFWGAEQLGLPGVTDWVNLDDFGVILAADAYLFGGFGASQNRFLHDVTITPDGTQAYLANWDAGLVLLDISDVTNPTVVSVAIAEGSEDGEVNSHSVWPNEGGNIVIEGEEDFAPFETVFSISSGPNAGEYPAAEGAITVPIDSLPGANMAGTTRYLGLACDGDPLPAAVGASEIALIQRGACAFTDKVNNADAAGYTGVVVFNDEARGDALVTMGGTAVNLPGVFVGHSTGLAIAGAAAAADLVVGDAGDAVDVSVTPNGWSGFRIWDYTDPTDPELASVVNTVCSATVVDVSCVDGGTYSSHNVIVETLGNKVLAYIAWYNDGIMVLDISDPYNPVEIARYLGNNEDGVLNDFWGVYKTPNDPFIYASDRNGGLYMMKMKGSGSGK